MAASEGQRARLLKQSAKLTGAALVRRFGADWRRFLTRELQRAVVAEEVLLEMIRRREDVTHEEMLSLYQATIDLIVGEEVV